MSVRKDFLSQAAPENYVAGLGRGATGFTTRSDLGPAREGPSEEQMKELLAKRAQQLGAAPPTAYGATEKKEENDDDDDRYQDPENEVGLFANGAYDREDDEADAIYAHVDERMGKRRKARREEREIQERKEYEANNPKIQQQFADLKRSLATVSDEDWANIPEVGDLTGKNKRTKQQRHQRFYAVPDSVLAGARDTGQMDTSVQDDDAQTNGESADGTMTNFADIGAAQNKVLQVRLDNAAQASGTDFTAGTSTNIDPKGYLTSLSKTEIKAGEVEVGDIKRVRGLLESVIKTNPKHAPGWIAAARLEEVAGKIGAARNVIARGASFCPHSEDMWLESMRLNENHNAKIIAANAIANNEHSTRLWVEAMKLESDPRAKKRVLRKALDVLETSVTLWKEAVNLEEDPAEAKLMLARAVEKVPSVELWLALARLETPENAQKVLNKARQAIPTSHEIWIAAARLQEQMGNDKINVMSRAVKSLARENAMLKREEWITEAEKCEEEGAILTCGAIIRETLGYGLDEEDDRKAIWDDDAKQSIQRGKYETARAIYAYSLRVFVNKKSVWLAAVDLERAHGTKEALFDTLNRAVSACPQSAPLWKQLAKEQRAVGLIDDCRRTLARAFQQLPGNEDIWLFAVELEAENHQIAQSRELLKTARDEAGTDRVWIKSVAFERVQNDPEAALDLVNRGLQIYPSAPKLWMMKGQTYNSLGKIPQAREAFSTGTRACPKSVPLWLLSSRIEEKAGVVVKARSVLDRARLAVPKNAVLWAESVRVERRAKNLAQAKVLMAKALQEVPTSGLLWSESIWHLEPRPQRKPRSLEAIKKVDTDPTLFVTVARVFWSERKLEKAASWFEKAIILDSDLGDTWAWYWKFLAGYGTDEKRQSVLEQIKATEPKHGELWASVRKDPRNAGKRVEEVLRIVVDLLED